MGKSLKGNESICRDSGCAVEDGINCESLGSLNSILDALDDVIDDVLQNAPPRVCSHSFILTPVARRG